MKQRSGLSTIDHYLDDFISAGKNYKSCVELMNTFKHLSGIRCSFGGRQIFRSNFQDGVVFGTRNYTPCKELRRV